MQLSQRPAAIAGSSRRTRTESGSISPGLILFALLLGALAALLVAHRRNHSVVAQPQVARDRAQPVDETPADPEELKAAEQVAPSAQSPFEVVARARAQNGPVKPPPPPSTFLASAPEQWGFAI